MKKPWDIDKIELFPETTEDCPECGEKLRKFGSVNLCLTCHNLSNEMSRIVNAVTRRAQDDIDTEKTKDLAKGCIVNFSDLKGSWCPKRCAIGRHHQETSPQGGESINP